MEKIERVLEGIWSNEELRSTCIPLFMGNPGLGKTKIIEKFAKDKNVNLVEIIASQLMPHEITGMAIPNKNENVMTYFDYDRFINLKDGDILFFDELLNANLMVLNACLTILENRTMISGKKLPKIMIVAAANYQGATVLSPQVKERFIWYDVRYSRNMFKKYMAEKYLMPDIVFEGINSLIDNEGFASSGKNYFSPRSIEKAINMIIKDIDTPYKSTLLPILNLMIENVGETPIKQGAINQLPGEKISYLKLLKEIKQ